MDQTSSSHGSNTLQPPPPPPEPMRHQGSPRNISNYTLPKNAAAGSCSNSSMTTTDNADWCSSGSGLTDNNFTRHSRTFENAASRSATTASDNSPTSCWGSTASNQFPWRCSSDDDGNDAVVGRNLVAGNATINLNRITAGRGGVNFNRTAANKHLCSGFSDDSSSTIRQVNSCWRVGSPDRRRRRRSSTHLSDDSCSMDPRCSDSSLKGSTTATSDCSILLPTTPTSNISMAAVCSPTTDCSLHTEDFVDYDDFDNWRTVVAEQKEEAIGGLDFLTPSSAASTAERNLARMESCSRCAVDIDKSSTISVSSSRQSLASSASDSSSSRSIIIIMIIMTTIIY